MVRDQVEAAAAGLRAAEPDLARLFGADAESWKNLSSTVQELETKLAVLATENTEHAADAQEALAAEQAQGHAALEAEI